ncbi:MAG: GAF domain-containing protein [bacterium]
MSLSEPALYLRLVDIAANPHIVSLYNSLRSVLPEAVWWVSDETLGRIPFPAAPTTPFCTDALLDENLRNRQIQKGQDLHAQIPPVGEVFPCCPGYCQGMAVFSYRGKSLGGIGLCHVPESQSNLLSGILTLLSGYLSLLSHTLEGNDDLEIVRSLWSETISVLDLNTLLRRIMDEVLGTLSLQKGVIFLMDEDGMFYVAHAQGVELEPLHQHPPTVGRFEYGKRIDRLHQRGTQCLDNEDPLVQWLVTRLPGWSDGKILGVPFFRNEYLIGLFATPVVRLPTFSPSRHRLLDLLSTGAATALDNALIFKRMHERRLALSTIHTVHRLMSSTDTAQDLIARVSQQARQLLKAGKCSMLLYDEKRSQLAPRFTLGLEENEVGSLPAKPGLGLVGWVAESYEALVYNPVPGRIPPWRDNSDRYPDRSYLAVPLIDEDLEGVLLLSGRKERFSPGDREILITLAEQIVLAIHNASIREGERRVAIKTLRGVANLLERGDPSTAGWTADICDLSERLGNRLGLSARDQEDLTYASLLCYSGLLRSANTLLIASEEPSRTDRRISCEIIQSLGLSRRVADIVSQADLRFDGAGAPDDPAGERILLPSRILAVATAFVAMTTPGMRGNREILSRKEALPIMQRRAGTVYDQRVVDALVDLIQST